jgi:hypothetical protein
MVDFNFIISRKNKNKTRWHINEMFFFNEAIRKLGLAKPETINVAQGTYSSFFEKIKMTIEYLKKTEIKFTYGQCCDLE